MAYSPPGETRRKVYEYLREQLLRGISPSLREVQQALRFKSVESARAQLEALVGEGLLVKQPGRARGYRLPEHAGGGRPPLFVPLLGRVQAGDLTLALEDPEGFLPIFTRRPPRGQQLFALKVRGESMTGVGILPGDIVIVRRQEKAESGDIVVAMVGEEATVKTLRRQTVGREGPRFILQPENPAFEPIVPEPGALKLLGKVIEVRRHLEAASLVEAPP